MKSNDFEKLIIKALYANEAVRNKVLPSLKSDWFFDIDNKFIIEKIIDFNGKYGKMPNVLETRQLLDDETTLKIFEECIALNDEEVASEFLLGEIEEFVRKKLLYNSATEISQYVTGSKQNAGSFADKVSDAETFSFDTNIGFSFFDDPKRLYEDANTHEKIYNSGLKTINDMIGGGFHEKSLNLIMSGCVSMKTKVKIRYKKSLNDSDYSYQEVEIEQVKELIKQGYDVEVDGPDGYSKVLRYVEKGPKRMFKITCNSKIVNASYDHLFETNDGWVLTKDLDPQKHRILCDDNKFHDFEMEFLPDLEDVVDIEVDNEKHRYFTDGLSSHNTNVRENFDHVLISNQSNS